ncbi:uncharacterized protein KZ484_000411 [Pholidichthys leucotaenia]
MDLSMKPKLRVFLDPDFPCGRRVVNREEDEYLDSPGNGSQEGKFSHLVTSVFYPNTKKPAVRRPSQHNEDSHLRSPVVCPDSQTPVARTPQVPLMLPRCILLKQLAAHKPSTSEAGATSEAGKCPSPDSPEALPSKAEGPVPYQTPDFLREILKKTDSMDDPQPSASSALPGGAVIQIDELDYRRKLEEKNQKIAQLIQEKSKAQTQIEELQTERTTLLEKIQENKIKMAKMFRRSRFSVRPNVSTAGRMTAAMPQEPPPTNQEASDTPREAADTAPAVPGNKCGAVVLEKAPASGDGNEQNGEGASTSGAVQRRKRFSVKPKVAPSRPAALARTPRSPAKAVSESPAQSLGFELEKPTTSDQTRTTAAAPKGLQSPRRRRPSEDGRQLKPPPKPSEPLATPLVEDPPEQSDQTVDGTRRLENVVGKQVKDGPPPRLPDKVPPSLPDKEAIEISEKARTLVSSKSVPSLTPSALSLSRLLNDPSDVERLIKAQKLRDLLREAKQKDKNSKKAKVRQREFSLDPSKMTMKDLIYYLPESNPMSLGDSSRENETVVPPSPRREKTPERAREPEAPQNTAGLPREDEEDAAEEDEELLMVPQVKVAEDGTLIIDEESLTVEVQRAKGPNPADDRDPIFERGSTTTYSSFRKWKHTPRWSSEETDMFFLAVSMVGTDFSMICQLFPHRARSEIKNKFKKEQRENAWRIDKAFRERRKLELEYFSKLLEKILEYQKSKKKLKSVMERRKRKPRAKKSAKKLSDVEEDDEEEDNVMIDLVDDEEEGEKENEDLCNEGEPLVSEAAAKRKRRNRPKALDEQPNEKEKRTTDESNKQGDVAAEDNDAGLPEDQNSDMGEKTQTVDTEKSNAIKPAKLIRGRAPKPLLPLGRKWGKKSAAATEAKDASSDKPEEGDSGVATKEQVNDNPSPLRPAGRTSPHDDDEDISSEEEGNAAIKPQGPTRYGRVPKPINPFSYPAKESPQPSPSSKNTPASPAVASAPAPKSKNKLKRGRAAVKQSAQKPKKPKLVMLTASQSESSEEDHELVQLHFERDGSAHVFVPASLQTPHPETQEVDESMVELDILDSMPDVLGITQDELCPDSSCGQSQLEMGAAESAEHHQLDLLVDVIDFLTSEHTEVSDDVSDNEAAQTLLTIGNLSHISLSAEPQDQNTGMTLADMNQTGHLDEGLASTSFAQEPYSIPCVSAGFDQQMAERSETVTSTELLDSGNNTSHQMQEESSAESSNIISPPAKMGRFSRIKPKPNPSGTSRTVQPKSKPEESHSVVPNLSKSVEMLSATKEIISKIPDCALIPCTEDILREKSSVSQDFNQLELSTVETDENSSVVPIYSSLEPDFKPRNVEIARELKITPEPTDENPESHVGPVETGFINPESFDSSSKESAPIQESDSKPSSGVSATRQPRRSRLQKVKPKPNLPQTSRIARFKPQITEETTEKDSKLIQDSELLKNTTAEQEPHQTSSPAHEIESRVTTDASPRLNSSAIPAEKEMERPVDFDVTRTDQGTEAYQTFFESQFETSGDLAATGMKALSEQPDEKFSSCNMTKETGFEDATTTVGQELSGDVALVQKSNSNPLPCISPAEDLLCKLKGDDETATESGCSNTVATSLEGLQAAQDSSPVQKSSGNSAEEVEITPTSEMRRSRFQKVKPKPNLLQTQRSARAKLQAVEEAVELSQAVEEDSTQDTKATVDPQPASISSPEKQSKSTDDFSVLKQSLNMSSSPTEELSANEKKKTDVELSSGAETSDQSVSESQNSSESQSEPSSDKTTSDDFTSDIIAENLVSHIETTESSCSNVVATSSEVFQVGQESSPFQESSGHSAEEVKVTSISQMRRSRFHKVRPKPNLQTQRSARAKPQILTQAEDSTQDTKATVDPQPASISSPEKQSESTDDFSELKQSLNMSSSPTEELSANEKKKTDVELNAGAETSDQSVSESQNSSESQIEPSSNKPTSDDFTSDITVGNLVSHIETTESSCSNVVATSAVVFQVGQESSPFQESSGHSAEEVKVTSISQMRRSRFQKVKPKPNLQTQRSARAKPQILTQAVEEDSTQDTKATLDPQPASISSPEKQSESTDDFSELKQSLNISSSPTEELSVNEEKKTDVELNSGAKTSDQSVSESQNSSESQIEPNNKTTSDNFTSDIIAGNLVSHIETIGNSCSNVVATSSEVFQVGQKSSPFRESSGNSAEEVKVASTSRLRRKVKPKLNLPQTSRSTKSQPQTTPVEDPSPVADMEPQLSCTHSPVQQSQLTGSASVLEPSLNLGSSCAPAVENSKNKEQPTEPSPSEDQFALNVDRASSDTRLTSGSTTESLMHHRGTAENGCNNVTTDLTILHVGEWSVQVKKESATSVEQMQVDQEEGKEPPTCQLRRSRLQKPEPNLLQVSRFPRTKFQTVEQLQEKSTDVLAQSAELVSTHTCQEEFLSTQVKDIDVGCEQASTSQGSEQNTDLVVLHVEERSAQVQKGSVTSVEQMQVDQEEDKVPPTCWLRRSRLQNPKPNLPPASRFPRSKSQTIEQLQEKSTEVLAQSMELVSTHTCQEEFSSTQVEDIDVGCAQASTSQGSEQNIPKGKRRFPKIIPKPILGSSSRTAPTKLQSHQLGRASEHRDRDTKSDGALSVTPAQSDSVRCSQAVDAPADPEVVPELRPGTVERVEGGTDDRQSSSHGSHEFSLSCLEQISEQQSRHDPPSDDVPASVDCQTQICSDQASSADVSAVFPGILPEQVPSDPDEPFFILSLMPIPVTSSGELQSCSDVPVMDTPIQILRTPEESSVAAVNFVSDVPEPVSTEEKCERHIDPDPSVDRSDIRETPVFTHGSTTVQPPMVPETIDDNEAEIPASAQKPAGPGRRAKPEVKVNVTGRKRTSKTKWDKDGESVPTPKKTNQDSESCGPSLQPPATDDGDHQKIVSRGEKAEIKTRRKPRETPSLLPSPKPSSSTLANTSSTLGFTMSAEGASSALTQTDPRHVTPSSSQYSAEDHGDSSDMDEEPTSVSQFFLSNIFTEVEDRDDD